MTKYTSYSHQLPVSTTPIDDMYIALGQNRLEKFYNEMIGNINLKDILKEYLDEYFIVSEGE